ncbi:hypothetical protein A9Q99_22050 [Gammaproteobacteria bacterium 45_16_T64]|nr:hypothetical protein A9Q99_22050 [Gammaproteobacteria bacterium 45_16_T64]
MSTKHSFLSLELNPDERFSTIKKVPGVPYSYMLREGNVLAEHDFPEGLEFPIAEESGNLTGDSVDNIFSCFLVSEPLKAFLSDIPELDGVIQYLPFGIVNKKGKRIPGDYYVANVTVSIDCFDTQNADYKPHPKTGKVWRIKTIEVEHDKIPENVKIFRLGEDKARILLRSDLVDAINSQGFTGLSVFATGATLP